MKNILILSPFNPYPLISGGHQAIFNGIAILNGIANVYLLIDSTESKWNRGEGREIEKVLPFVKVVPFIAPESRHTLRWYLRVLYNKFIHRFLVRATEKKSYEVQKQSISGVNNIRREKVDLILKCISEFHIDIVQVEMMANIKIVELLPPNMHTIFVHHELKFVRDELLVMSQGKLTAEIKELLKRNKEEEVRLLNLYDDVVTLSPIDTQKLIEAGVSSPISTSFSIVRDDSDNSNYPTEPKKLLIYVGPESHYPNYEGILWFLNNCWDKLLSKDGGYKLQIIGKWSEETSSFLSERYTGVSCVGFVDCLSDASAGSTLIVPLNIGSGIRMKILEAARIGVPVVTTSVGVEGLPLLNGKHVFIADNPDEFVEDICKLQDETLRSQFVQNTREIISSKYSFEKLKANRIKLYE